MLAKFCFEISSNCWENCKKLSGIFVATPIEAVGFKLHTVKLVALLILVTAVLHVYSMLWTTNQHLSTINMSWFHITVWKSHCKTSKSMLMVGHDQINVNRKDIYSFLFWQRQVCSNCAPQSYLNLHIRIFMINFGQVPSDHTVKNSILRKIVLVLEIKTTQCTVWKQVSIFFPPRRQFCNNDSFQLAFFSGSEKLEVFILCRQALYNITRISSHTVQIFKKEQQFSYPTSKITRVSMISYNEFKLHDESLNMIWNVKGNSELAGSVPITIKVSTNGATSHMNLSGYVGHVTTFSWMFTIVCCLVVGLRLGLGLIRFSVWLCISICTTFDCHCHTAELGSDSHWVTLVCGKSGDTWSKLGDHHHFRAW